MPIRGSHNPSTLPFTLEEIAQKTGARLQALAASPELAGLQAEYEVRSGKPFVELITGARASLDNVDWGKSTGEGRAAVAIIGRAKQIQADMIVIATHGRSGLPHMLLGSVVEKVVRAASCPVPTIRPEVFQFALP